MGSELVDADLVERTQLATCKRGGTAKLRSILSDVAGPCLASTQYPPDNCSAIRIAITRKSAGVSAQRRRTFVPWRRLVRLNQRERNTYVRYGRVLGSRNSTADRTRSWAASSRSWTPSMVTGTEESPGIWWEKVKSWQWDVYLAVDGGGLCSASSQ